MEHGLRAFALLASGMGAISCLTVTASLPVEAAIVYGQGTWESTLLPRDLDGDGKADAFYDTAQNITWLGNVNAGAGSVYDDGASTTDGGMTWQGAVNWANNFSFGGYDSWRLARATDTGTPGCNETFSGTDCGFNVDVSTGEMAHLYYVALGNLAQFDSTGARRPAGTWGLWNSGPFWNIPNVYDLSSYQWLETELATDSNRAIFFYMSNGLQKDAGKTSQMFAWAVHDGDIGQLGEWTPCPDCVPSPCWDQWPDKCSPDGTPSVVPLPAAAWLLLSGLAGLGVLGRRRKH